MEKECLARNCHICGWYGAEEIGDSDHGAIYSDRLVCLRDKDRNDDTDEYIKDFDYTSEKKCCVPEFWLDVGIDDEIAALFDDEAAMSDDLYSTDAYKIFEEKYGTPNKRDTKQEKNT